MVLAGPAARRVKAEGRNDRTARDASRQLSLVSSAMLMFASQNQACPPSVFATIHGTSFPSNGP